MGSDSEFPPERHIDTSSAIEAKEGWRAVYLCTEDPDIVVVIPIEFWVRDGKLEMVPLVVQHESQRLVQACDYDSSFSGEFLGLLRPGESEQGYVEEAGRRAKEDNERDRHEDAKEAQKYFEGRGFAVTETEARAFLDFMCTSNLKHHQPEIPQGIIIEWLAVFRWRYPKT